MVFWITGRAGAGKSTLAKRMAGRLREQGFSVKVLDGDKIREDTQNQDFSDRGRFENIMLIAHMAQFLESCHHVVIVACVSPKKAWRETALSMFRKAKLIYLPGGTLWEGTTYEEP